MTDVDPEILAVFAEESAERIDRMVQALLAVESGKADVEAVHVLFRETHSIKGSAGMVNLQEAVAIAHAIEDLLGPIRERDAFPTELADPLLRATDALRRAIAGEACVAASAVAELKATNVQADGEQPAPAPPKESRPAKSAVRSLRTSADKIDRLLDAVGETVLHQRRLEHMLGDDAREARGAERVEEELARGGVLIEDLQESVIRMRTLPLSSITGQMPRAVRDLARAHGIRVELTLQGVDTQLDRMMLDGISDALTHVLRNAIAHGIEPPEERERAGKPATGQVQLSAEQRGSMVAITVADDGRGVAQELVSRATGGQTLAELLTRRGLSTAAQVTDVAGRGVGLDAVKAHVESLGGGLEIASEPGRGTSVTLTIPLTLALLRVLLVDRAGQIFGLPLASVEEAVTVTHTTSLGGRAAIELRGRSIPLSDLAQIVRAPATPLPDEPKAVVVSSSGRRMAVACDRLVEEQEVVIKSLGALLEGVPGYLGAAILGNGRIALILDPAFVTRQQWRTGAQPVAKSEHVASKVLVVDDQFTVRELQRSILEAAGYRVETARDGSEALAKVVSEPDVGLVVTDIEMPHMDGFELLRSIRSEPQRSSLPIVVVTARGGEEDRRKGVEVGADAYLVKDDFNQQALLDTVERLLAR